MPDITPENWPDRIFGVLRELLTSPTAVPKAVAKLLDTCGEQIGLWAEPFHHRRMADARAAAALALAKARVEVETIEVTGRVALVKISDREEARLLAKEARRQRNREATVAGAVRALPEHVSDAPVDPDWVAHFFDCCQDIGDEQMHVLWGRLLAGEVTNPGTYSRQTLATVRLLSKEDADLFTRVCGAAWSCEREISPFLVSDASTTQLLSLQSRLHRLESLGLINVTAVRRRQLDATASVELTYFGRVHRLTMQPFWLPQTRADHLVYHTGHFDFTYIGRELQPIAGGLPNDEYRQAVVRTFQTQQRLDVDDGPDVQPNAATGVSDSIRSAGQN
jgi:hypothetical protein